jgi:release factor glutamine methyltransferase
MNANSTIAEALTDTAQRLRAAGIDGARWEARLLVGHALGLGDETVIGYPERVVPATALEMLDRVVLRRARREPMSHVLGRREFWSLTFRVTADTLDPRPDSETMITATLAVIDDRTMPYRVLDLGTGSGCLLLALLSELPNATGVGTDLSPAALVVARVNALALGFGDRCGFHQGDWDCGLDGDFDIIVSNPPYVPSDEIDGLQPEVSLYEPRLALDGGPDGLDGYRALSGVLARRLAAGGVATVELGANQIDRVTSIMSDAGLDIGPSQNDLGGMPRSLVARARPKLTGLKQKRVGNRVFPE